MLQTDLKAIAVGRLNIKVYRRRKEFILKKIKKQNLTEQGEK